MTSVKKTAAAFAITIAMLIIGGSYTHFAEACETVRENAVRLHIIANSDSAEDQALKLALRDAMLARYSPRLAEVRPGDAIKAAGGLCADMQQAAERFIKEQGYDYAVAVSVVDMYFDTSHYEGFTMPAGHYKAMRFEIGEAAGRNWWCVMYPPLCVPAASEGQAVEMTERIAALSEPMVYKPAFAVVEAVEKIKDMLGIGDQ